MLKIFGIKQCSTMQKAFAWLDDAGLTYEFHDYKKLGIATETLTAWCREADWNVLLNTRGTTWRKLSEEERNDVDQDKAIQLMQRYPSLIKRPVISDGKQLLIGFDPARYAATLGEQDA